MRRLFTFMMCMLINVGLSTSLYAAVMYQYGGVNSPGVLDSGTTYRADNFWANQTINWNVLNNVNTGYKTGSSSPEITFVGSTQSPGSYFAVNNDYVFFRVRTKYTGTVSTATFSDTVMCMINVNNYNYTNPSSITNNSTSPDFAFSWDSKSNDITKHGLEMQAIDKTAGPWNAIQFQDLDTWGNQNILPTPPLSYAPQSASTKFSFETAPKGPDFGVHNGDGFVRTIDGVSYIYTDTNNQQQTTTSTFIDFAISKAYLTNIAPPIINNPSWQIQFGAIANATDHNAIGNNGDVAGGATLTDMTYSGTIQSNVNTVPEPSTYLLLGISLGTVAWCRRRMNHKQPTQP